MAEPDDETVERSVTLSRELENAALEEFGGLNRSDALRRAIVAGVTCERSRHDEDVHRLVEMLHAERIENEPD